MLDSTRVFRLARAVGLNIVVMDYIEAAKLRGEGLGYLIFKEVLPNATAPLLAEFGLRFCFVFLAIAALSFLGLGIQPPLADWGSMVSELSQFISFATFAPVAASLPLMAAGAIALLTVALLAGAWGLAQLALDRSPLCCGLLRLASSRRWGWW